MVNHDKVIYLLKDLDADLVHVFQVGLAIELVDRICHTIIGLVLTVEPISLATLLD